jgi:hypothetical protein
MMHYRHMEPGLIIQITEIAGDQQHTPGGVHIPKVIGFIPLMDQCLIALSHTHGQHTIMANGFIQPVMVGSGSQDTIIILPEFHGHMEMII